MIHPLIRVKLFLAGSRFMSPSAEQNRQTGKGALQPYELQRGLSLP